MIIQVNPGDVDFSEALEQHVRQAVESALKHHVEQVTRVEAHLRDDNAKKSGPADKRCVLEARLAGMDPLAVDAAADDLYKAVTESAHKLGRAVQHKLERAGA